MNIIIFNPSFLTGGGLSGRKQLKKVLTEFMTSLSAIVDVIRLIIIINDNFRLYASYLTLSRILNKPVHYNYSVRLKVLEFIKP